MPGGPVASVGRQCRSPLSESLWCGRCLSPRPLGNTSYSLTIDNKGDSPRHVRALVIGAGQAGLAVGYYLRRADLASSETRSGYVLVDAAEQPGGAWARMWPRLRAFSPPEYSSLPGWLMPPWTGDSGYPPAAHIVDYLTRYEQRYQLSVHRSMRALSVSRVDKDPTSPLLVTTSHGNWYADHVVSATGTWSRPFVPRYPGAATFTGRQLHTVKYHHAAEFAGQLVVVVGGGNSAAQILAEISLVADTTWVTRRPPRLLPDDVDGRVLFDVATARRRALESGRPDDGGIARLGDIVAIPTVRDARERGVLTARPMFERLTPDGVQWSDGSQARADTIVWCTGFRPSVGHLSALGLRGSGGQVDTGGLIDTGGQIDTGSTRSVVEPRLHLVGYGDWTGPASATLIGVGRTARETVRAITTPASIHRPR